MKVLHLSTFDRVGGACIAAFRQHEALCRAGVDSRMWVRSSVSGNSQVVTYRIEPGRLARMRRMVRRRMLVWEASAAHPSEEFLDERSDLGAEIVKSLPDADVYNIQFSQGFIDHKSLFQSVPIKRPFVVTLHEMSWFTGGCSYDWGCRRFEGTCGSCPSLGRSGPADYSFRGWQRRRDLFRLRPNIAFVANSNWTASQARASTLLRDKSVTVVPLSLDTQIFKPMDKQVARRALGIPDRIPVVAFAAATVTDKRKGMKHLLEALELLHEDPILLTWGRNVHDIPQWLPYRHLGNLESEHLAALAYNAADVFVMPSLEESFGLTALEAVSCGVPVVAFDVGGIPETVESGLNGFLVPRGDSRALAHGISHLLHDTVMRERWTEMAAGWAEANFSYEKSARAYIKLYEQLLEMSLQ